MGSGADLSDEHGITARDREIYELRIEGLTLEKIGERFGLTKMRISQIVRDVAGKLPQETRDQARSLDLSRVEHLMDIAQKRYESGDQSEGRLLLDFLKRRAALLGTEAPQQVHVEGRTTYEIVGVDVKGV
jgi:DNA-binding CsgD family transcriptional regulator